MSLYIAHPDSTKTSLLQLPKSEEDITMALPDKGTTIETMTVCKLLSSKSSKSLGNWEFQFQFEPAALAAEKQ